MWKEISYRTNPPLKPFNDFSLFVGWIPNLFSRPLSTFPTLSHSSLPPSRASLRPYFFCFPNAPCPNLASCLCAYCSLCPECSRLTLASFCGYFLPSLPALLNILVDLLGPLQIPCGNIITILSSGKEKGSVLLSYIIYQVEPGTAPSTEQVLNKYLSYGIKLKKVRGDKIHE